MKITRRTDYAIHLLADLSENPDKPLGLRALAEKHHVTYAFARTVQQGLLKAGIVSSMRGISGGIKLAKPLSEISLLEVFEAAQDPLSEAFSSEDASWCSCKNGCVSETLWKSAQTVLGDYLAGITMHHVINSKQ